jgi:ABC-2 type transport system ATP-binding protein
MQLDIQQLVKKYNSTIVLDIPSLQINSGELIGIVGNNGAGKTTLLRLITDLIEPGSGEIKIGNEPVRKSKEWKKHTGSFLDEGFLIGFLTPEEYFIFNGHTYGLSAEAVTQRLPEYDSFMKGEVINTKKYIRQLSTGNKQKTGIIAAMLVNPALLLLDEPFNFLDPSSQIIVKNLLKKKNKETGATIIISSHNINHVADICTRIILLEKGRIIKDVSTNDKQKVEEIQDYFTTNAE